MKVLFATTNLAKVRKYKEKLKENGIELITINDLDFKLDVDENGKNALENAYIKAKAYYDIAKIPTIGMDDCLFIEGLPEEKQPGTHVRRINGKELADDEMIEYYTNLIKMCIRDRDKDRLVGIQNGIDTCWFNPKKISNNQYEINYEISNLIDLKNIL